ncbi:MAG: aspartate kinase [Eubacteriales bacterium]|nr:aspartate kinase [Eubacteriales bacterium]MDY2933208.1 aspartate kinase [Anaerovoracaceae bacterium]MEE0180203.1 aspartate kinase [Anaerovoracaceae bacterium]
MGLKVAKFGGSSVADAIQLMKIKKIIEADSERRYIVVSAPGKRFDKDNKITDLLYLCKTHMDHNLPYEQVLQVIQDRYVAAAVGLGLDIDYDQQFQIIKDKLEKGEATADYLASRGEYLNAILAAKLLGYDFVDTDKLIKFSAKGRLLAEETNEALAAELAKHERAVLPGFYGSTPDGKIKTFSRGGSDITGALVARAAGADIYENWTDVSGFLMADPRIVDNPKPIAEISYRELRELSYMGASVLHDEAIYPAKEDNIPINIRNTNRPEDPGTIITADAPLSDHIITGIAGSKNFTVIGLSKSMMSQEVGFVRRLAGVFADKDVSLEHMPSGIDTISVVVDNDELNGKLDDIVDEIQRQLQPDTIDVFENMALIATVGRGMSSRTGTSAKLFTALADAGVNIRMIDQGSSEINIIVGVQNKDFEKAVKAIYDAFVE